MANAFKNKGLYEIFGVNSHWSREDRNEVRKFNKKLWEARKKEL